MSTWWNHECEIPIEKENFQRIIDFYLFCCPCEIEKGSKKKGTKVYTKVSKRGKTLRSLGWTGGQLNTLLATMKCTASGHLEYHTYKCGANIAEAVCSIEKSFALSDPHFEIIAMMERSDMNKTSAIFYYIRNAFAHGSFSVVHTGTKNIYYFESMKEDVVWAQVRLREETLLKWIDDLSFSPTVLKKSLEQNRKQRKEKARGKKAA